MKRLFWWVTAAALFPVLSSAQPSPSIPSASQSTLDALQMLQNLSNSYPALWLMITGISYLLGLALAVRAVLYLKVYGELRTMTATQSSLKIPIVYLLAACVFLFIPTGFKTLEMTVFGTSSPLGYQQMNTTMNPIVLKAVGGFVELLGLVSFVRGWMMLVHNAQSPGGGQASFGKALTHIIGGFLLLNVYGLASVIWNTFGLTSPL